MVQFRIMPRTASRSARAGKYGKRPRRVRITAEQFQEARKSAGFTREEACGFLGVSLRTIGHWETGKARPPYAAFKLLRVYRNGDLIDPAWAGYSIIRGKLVTPENRVFEPGDLSWLSLLVNRARLFSEAVAMKGRGTPLAAAPRGGAAASGLVYIETSGNAVSGNTGKQGFSVSCKADEMGPQWGHEASRPEVQSEVTRGSDGGSEGPSRRHRRLVERVCPVRSYGASEANPARVGRPRCRQAIEGGVASINRAGRVGGQGRAERSVPVRQRPKGKALPSGKLLTVGGTP